MTYERIMLTIVKITDIHKLSDNDTGYPNMGRIVKFNTIPIIIPIVVDVKLSIKDCLLLCKFFYLYPMFTKNINSTQISV